MERVLNLVKACVIVVSLVVFILLQVISLPSVGESLGRCHTLKLSPVQVMVMVD